MCSVRDICCLPTAALHQAPVNRFGLRSVAELQANIIMRPASKLWKYALHDSEYMTLLGVVCRGEWSFHYTSNQSSGSDGTLELGSVLSYRSYRYKVTICYFYYTFFQLLQRTKKSFYLKIFSLWW